MKKIKSIITIMLLICLLTPHISFAGYSASNLGNIIANFGKEMTDKGLQKDLFYYSQGNMRMTGPDYFFGKRDTLYTGKVIKNGEYPRVEDKLCFDCSSFVGFIYDYVCDAGTNGWNTDSFKSNRNGSVFECVTSSSANEMIDASILRPGDIILKHVKINNKWTKHAMLYIGGGQYVHASSSAGIITYGDVGDWSRKGVYILRVRESFANSVDSVNTTLNWPDGSETDSWDGNYEDIENVPGHFEYDENGNPINVNFAESEFYYNGIPTRLAYGGKVDIKDWVFNVLTDILDWLVGLLLMGHKIQLVGWSNIFSTLVTDFVEEASKVTIEGQLTVESIVYNKVPLLDINFFDFSQAGGASLSQDSILYIIRQSIASWYVTIRYVTIIGMLVTLIYIGIRAAITTVAEKRAVYKEMLFNWLVSFILIFVIHYFMIIVVNITHSLIGMFEATGGELPLYETLLISIWKIEASESWMATLTYVAMIYYTIRFLFVYLKRLMILCILTLLAPVVGIGYAIDRVKNNKSKSLSKWMKEYTVNVVIQFIHAMLYTILIEVLLGMISSVDPRTFISTIVIAFVFFNFMLKAETLVRKIFKIGDGSSSVKDIFESTASAFGGFYLAKNLAGTYYNKVIKPVGSKVTAPVTAKIDTKLKERIKNSPDFQKTYGKTMPGKTVTDINEKLDQAAQNELNARKQYAKDVLKGGASIITSRAKNMAKVPLLITQPSAAFAMMAFNNSERKYKTGMIKTITSVKNSPNKKYTAVKAGANFLSSGAYSHLEAVYGKEKAQIMAYYPAQRQILNEAQNAEVMIEQEKDNLRTKGSQLYADTKPNATAFDISIAQKRKQQLQENLQDVFRQPPTKDEIKKVVARHIEDNNFKSLNEKQVIDVVNDLGITPSVKFGTDIKKSGVTKLNVEQLTNVISEKLQDRSNIQLKPVTPEFKPIVQQAEKLREANEKHIKLSKKPIYKDYDELIKSIIEK